ncbi:beta-glucosidase-8 [Coleophoma crateriformis]|uniref:beta-glucosidase n=1 Tax=Coleophoma crateriformis TaxID=565419 RepID=A0A3D8T177_9HELO|nr:beta-glucosidase-8 [Coleophoma crateriformis]
MTALKVLDIEALIEQLTLTEKVALTAGSDFWHTTAIPRLDIPALRLSDGPNGVRGRRFFNGVPAACLPCATALGATFDRDLLKSAGILLGKEAKSKGAHVLLGPTINIQRSPLGGRGFESFSEDPFLSGVLAGEYCKGVKEEDIIATLKHFVCNDQEHERMAVDSIVTERALREIYLMPFMLAIKSGMPEAMMTAYNKVNGTHVSENPKIYEILRKEWKWSGLVMSDWFGTYSTTEAVTAGLDLEMPGPSRWRSDALAHAVSSNKLPEFVLDERVREVLNLINVATKSGVPADAEEEIRNTADDQALNRRFASESIVLLKNEGSILPLKKDKTVAVIGPNAKVATFCGGGSASLLPYYTVSPFEGVSAKCSDVKFSQGAYSHKELPLLGRLMKTFDGKLGFHFRAYLEPPSVKDRECVDDLHITDSNCFLLDYKCDRIKTDLVYADFTGTFTPEEDGVYEFGVTVQGTAKFYIDGELIIDNTENQIAGGSFFGSGTIEVTGTKELVGGKTYTLLSQWGSRPTSKLQAHGVVSFGIGGHRLAGCRIMDPASAIADAVKLAGEVDQVVLFAGLNGDWESEGHDRANMDLPPYSDELISKVLDANPNTTVVIQSGTPVAMPWASKAKSLVQAWYGGNETGNAIADVLFGDVNPGGKLPLTFPKRVQDNPAFLNYRSEGGRTLYGEDVYVGYRYYEKTETDVLFPFGYGLSYTTFSLSSLTLTTTAQTVTATVTVKNTGAVAGTETVQLYISPKDPSIGRPNKEMKGFQKVLLQPGESKEVTIEVDTKLATSFYGEIRKAWISEQGEYEALVGNSSQADFLKASFKVEKTTYWVGLDGEEVYVHKA